MEGKKDRRRTSPSGEERKNFSGEGKKYSAEGKKHAAEGKKPDPFEADIRQACEVMRRGGVILYPTDTVWGIGCDATNEDAVRRVFEIKRRADSKSLLLLVDSDAKVSLYVKEVPTVAWDLIELSEKPLTIIYDHSRNLAANVVAADGSVGIRVTREEFSRRLCYRFGKAVVSTSANISGEPTPRVFSEISPEIVGAVDYVVGCRRKEKAAAKPSSIIRLNSKSEIQIIRE